MTEEIPLSSIHSLTRNCLILSVISAPHGFDPLDLLTYLLNHPASGSALALFVGFWGYQLGLPAPFAWGLNTLCGLEPKSDNECANLSVIPFHEIEPELPPGVINVSLEIRCRPINEGMLRD